VLSTAYIIPQEREKRKSLGCEVAYYQLTS
jgi:hypothetical protein